MSARSLMVMGTASDVGKSVVVAGLCRLFAKAGLRVAPFKSQNMSNNAAVCIGGGEIGRAQAVQAEACGLEPSVDMNPVLLKPESDRGCQVVIGGQARFRMTASEYSHYRARAWPVIVESYARLAERFELIVIEGAGGAAEVNLRDRDIVNFAIAELADAPVLIVADIDKGGALAALVGTVALLSEAERRRVKGLIINKFRGDPALLYDGLKIIEANTGVPVLGVLPHAGNLEIPEEDGAGLKAGADPRMDRPIKIGVLVFPRIANYTDFEPFLREPDISLRYLEKPEQAGQLDVLCLPGTKSTIADLGWLRALGWERFIASHCAAGGSVVGICGGYQMLGRQIDDPEHSESHVTTAKGLGLLPIATIFASEKITARVDAVHIYSGLPIAGYEIHCGRISRFDSAALFRIGTRDGSPHEEFEGAMNGSGTVVGTSIHGLFDAPQFRRHFLNQVRERKGLAPLPFAQIENARTLRLQAYDRFAEVLQENLDIAAIAGLIGVEAHRLRY
ncbi:MAG: cobyric acid synthase [Candidatus Binataceae bacterium]|jgi:adenosylcobyric acid synthase